MPVATLPSADQRASPCVLNRQSETAATGFRLVRSSLRHLTGTDLNRSGKSGEVQIIQNVAPLSASVHELRERGSDCHIREWGLAVGPAHEDLAAQGSPLGHSVVRDG